ncbi:MAG: AraC family transcriptional regulator [Ferruginibacter sp.]
MEHIRKKQGFEGQKAITLPKKILFSHCETNPIVQHAYITDIGYYPKAKHHYCKRANGIDQHIIIYCVEGSGYSQIGETRYDINAGDFVIIPANTPHLYAASQDIAWTIYWLHFKGKTGDAVAGAMIEKLSGHKGVIGFNPKRESLFEELYNNLERGYGSENIMYANMCLWHLMASFQFDNKFDDSSSESDTEPAGVAIDFMQQQIGNILTLAQIAQHVNLSVSHFTAIFHAKTGFAPIEYFNHLKIQKACKYIQFTENRMKEIAYDIGINDSYYFSRLFKKLMGMSPLHYRKRFRK